MALDINLGADAVYNENQPTGIDTTNPTGGGVPATDGYFPFANATATSGTDDFNDDFFGAKLNLALTDPRAGDQFRIAEGTTTVTLANGSTAEVLLSGGELRVKLAGDETATVIGTVGQNGTQANFAFTTLDATDARVEAAVRALQFASNSEDPSGSLSGELDTTRTFTASLRNGNNVVVDSTSNDPGGNALVLTIDPSNDKIEFGATTITTGSAALDGDATNPNVDTIIFDGDTSDSLNDGDPFVEDAGDATSEAITLAGTLNFSDPDYYRASNASTDIDLGQFVAELAITDAGANAVTPENQQALLAALSLSNPSIGSTGSGSVSFGITIPAGALDFIAAGETLTFTYTITLTDRVNTGDPTTNDTITLVLSVTGSNDAPVITVEGGNSIVATVDEDDDADGTDGSNDLFATGTLTVSDVDVTDEVTASVTDVVASTGAGEIAIDVGTGAVNGNTASDLLALFSVSPTAILDGTQTSAQLAWTFADAQGRFDFLDAGDELVLTYTIAVNDGTVTDTQTVTITVTGTNDAPVVAADGVGGADLSATITEIADGQVADDNGTAGDTSDDTPAEGDPQTVTGTIVFTDVDADDTPTISVGGGMASYTDADENPVTPNATQQTALDALLSTITLTPDGQNGNNGTVGWSYTVDDDALDFLAEGETVTLTYAITATDDNSGTDTTQDIVITITGTNDAPEFTVGNRTSTIAEDDVAATDDAETTFDETTTLVATDTLTFTDADFTDTHTASVSGTVDVTPAGGVAPSGAAYDALVAALQSAMTAAVTTDSLGGTTGEVTTTFALDNALAQFLAAGESVTATYTIDVADGEGNSTGTREVAVTVTGTNDDPTIVSADATSAITEVVEDTDDGNGVEGATLTDTGTVTFADVDLTDEHTAEVAEGTVTPSTDVVLPDGVTRLGTFTIDPVDQETNTVGWTFSVEDEDLDFLGAGDTVTQTYTITIDDGNEGTVEQLVTVTITGSNDAPVISVESGDSVAATVNEDDDAGSNGLVATGTLTVTDVDVTDEVTASVTGVVASQGAGTIAIDGGSVNGISASDLQALLSVSPTAILDGTQTSAQLVWTFADAQGRFDFLDVGDQLVLTYTVTVDDGTTTDTQTVTITVTGTNDAPVVAADGVTVADVGTADLTAAIAEITDNQEADNGTDPVTPAEGADQTVTGTIVFTDVDADDTPTISVGTGSAEYLASDGEAPLVLTSGQESALLSTITLTPDGQNGNNGTVGWSYTVDDDALDFLAEGETVTLTYAITATDDNTGTDTTQDIVITITGTNDAPVFTAGVQASTVTEDDVAATDDAGTTIDETTTLVATDTLTFTDADFTDTHTASVSGTVGVTTAGDVDTSSSQYAALVAALEAAMTAAVTTESLGGTTGEVTTTFALDNALAQFLADGESVTATYTIDVLDGTGNSTGTREVAITVTGTNDDPVANNDTNSVVEAGTVTDDAGDDIASTPAIGNVILGRDVGGMMEGTDTDADSSDELTVTQISAGSTTETVDATNNATSQNGQTITGQWGTLTIGADGSYSYQLDETKADVLDEGEDESDVFTYTISDGITTDTAMLTVNITGTNDAPVISVGSDEGTVIEAGTDANGDAFAGTVSVSGTLSVSDVDGEDTTDNDNWSVDLAGDQTRDPEDSGNANVVVGTYGTFTIDENGAWSYELDNTDADTQALDTDDEVTETFTVRVTDQNGASDTHDVTITITGTNDAPVLAAVSDKTYADTEAADDFAVDSGTLEAVDPDDTVTFGITDGTEASGSVEIDEDGNGVVSFGYDVSKAGTYGTLYLDSASGEYVYVPDDAAINALTGTVTESFTFTAGDGEATDTTTYTVTLNGANDRPTLGTIDAESFNDTAANNDFADITGQLVGGDLDDGQTLSYGVEGGESVAVTIGGTTYHTAATNAYGTLYVVSFGPQAGAYRFVPNDAAINALTATTTTGFTFTVTDSSGETATETGTGELVITLNGDDDTPEITVMVGDVATAALTETDAGLTASGTLTVTDRDTADDVSVMLAGAGITGDGTYEGELPVGLSAALAAMLTLPAGALAADAPDGTQFTWAFDSGSEAFDFLNAGDTLVIAYTIAASDGAAPFGSQVVTITITGTNDGPVANADTNAITERGTDVTLAGEPEVFASQTKTGEAEQVTGNVITGAGGVDTDADADAEIVVNGLATGDQTGNTAAIDNTDFVGGGIVGRESGDADAVRFTEVAESEDGAGDGEIGIDGTYGVLFIRADGSYRYELDNSRAATQALDEGETPAEVFTYRIADDQGAESVSTLSIAVSGQNDAPVAVDDVLGSEGDPVTPYSDQQTAVADEDSTVTIQASELLANDTDVDDAPPSIVALGESGETELATATLSVTTQMGATATLDAETGAITYDASRSDSLAALAHDETATDSFTYVVEDDDGARSLATVQIVVQGRNDGPVIVSAETDDGVNGNGIDSDGLENAALTEADAALSASGSFTVSDVDLSDVVTASVTGVTASTSQTDNVDDVEIVTDVNGLVSVNGIAVADILAMLSLDPSAVIDGSTTSGTLGWTFASDDATNLSAAQQAFDFLDAGDVLTLTYTVQVDDGNGFDGTDNANEGSTATETVTITITGTNDGPVLVADGETVTIDGTEVTAAYDGAITELGDGATAPDENTATRTTSGTIVFTDLDADDTPEITVAAGTVASYTDGDNAPIVSTSEQQTALDALLTAIELTPTGGNANNGSVGWSYSISDGALDFLAAGETVTLNYGVTATDDAGETATRTIQITLTGAQDAPVATNDAPTGVIEAGGIDNGDAGVATASGNVLDNDVDADLSDMITVDGAIAGTDMVSDLSFAAVATTDGVNSLNENDDRFDTQVGEARIDGTYGSLFIQADGSYRYVLDDTKTETQALDENDSPNDVFTYRVTDDSATPGTDLATLTIAVTGANDAPTLEAVAPITYTDTAAPDDFAATTGSLAAEDVDGSAVLSYGISGATGSGTTIGGKTYDVSKVGAFGTLFLSTTTGEYRYEPNDDAINALNEGETPNENFTFTVTDENDASASTALILNFVGADDAIPATESDDFITATGRGGTYNSAEEIDGRGGDDVIYGGGGDDDISGGAGDDVIYGGSGNDDIDFEAGDEAAQAGGNTPSSAGFDTIYAGSGDDRIAAGYGDDTIDGGSGEDTVVFTGTRDQYTITRSGQTIIVQDNVADRDGIDVIRNVESFQFDDGDGNPDLFTSTNLSRPVAVDDVNASAATENGAAASGNVLTNDADADGTALTVTGVATGGELPGDTPSESVGMALQGTYGTLTLSADGSYVYTVTDDSLAAGETVTESFAYAVTSGGQTDVATLTVTAIGTNDAPVVSVSYAVDGEGDPTTSGTIAEGDAAGATGASVSVVDVDGETPVLAIIEGNDDGLFAIGTDGAITTTRVADDAEVGARTLLVQATDGSGATDTVSVAVTVTNTDDAPVLSGGAVTTTFAENTAGVVGQFTASDADGDAVVYSLSGDDAGKFAITAGGVLTFLGADFETETSAVGDDAVYDVTVNATANGVTVSSDLIQVAVTNVNEGPVAVDDVVDGEGAALSTAEETAITLDVLGNDTDADNVDPVAANAGLSIISAESDDGTVAIVAGKLVFTPKADFNGTAEIAYTISDGDKTSSAVATVSVTAVNDAPVFGSDAVQISTAEDTAVTGSVSASDVDSQTLTYSLATDGANGTAVVNGDGSYSYTPGADFAGADSFVIKVTDGNETDTITVNVTVDPENDAPVAANGTASATEDAGAVSIDVADLVSDVETADAELVVTAAVDPQQGTVSVSGTVITFTPAANFNGSADIAYTVKDAGGLLASATVAVTVAAENDVAVFGSPSVAATVAEDAVLSGQVAASDVDGDALSYAAVDGNGPAHGVVTVNADGSYQYAANADYAGADSFQIAVFENGASEASDTITVNVAVSAVNDAPIAGAVAPVTVAEDGTASGIDVAGVAGDVDGDTVVVTSVSSQHGSVAIAGDGTVTYTPNGDFHGADTISYTLSDGHGGVAAGEVAVTVTAENDAPVVAAGSASTDEDGSVAIDVAGLISDIDGDGLTVTAASSPNGTVAITGTVLTFTPAADFNGETAITYTVSDGTTTSDGTLAVSVSAENDAPVVSVSYAVDGEGAPTTSGTIAEGDAAGATGASVSVVDVDGETPVLAIIEGNDDGLFAIGTDGAITTTRVADDAEVGARTLLVQATDGSGATDTVSVAVTVTNTDDAPVLSGGAVTTTFAENTAGVVGQFTASDADGDAVVYSLSGDDAGKFAITAGGVLTFLGADFETETSAVGDDAVYDVTVNATANGVTVSSDLIQVAVTNVDDEAPVAGTVSGTTVAEDGTVTIDVLSSASDVDTAAGDLSIVSAESQNGTVAIVNGQLVFTPKADFNGTAEIAYAISDGERVTTATVSVAVTPVDDAPVFGANQTLAVQENAANGSVVGTVTATDIDSQNLSFTLLDDAGGRFTINQATGEVSVADGLSLDFEQAAMHAISVEVSDGSTAVVKTLVVSITNVDPEVVVADDTGRTIYGGVRGDTLTGGAASDSLYGQGGNDVIDGKAGADTMSGGTGNDTFYVDDAGDVVLENAGEGTDQVFSSISRTLSQNVENLTLTGTGNIDGTGNDLDNVILGNGGNNILIGNGGNDTLNGGAGADRMEGGTGNDTYFVDNAGDVVVEAAGSGTDSVVSSVSFGLRNFSQNLENLTLIGAANINGTGNSLSNTIVGNDGDNVLNGAMGSDILIGGGGNDTFQDDYGADYMAGGTGNDTYFVDNAGDVIVEEAGEGTDTVNSVISFALRDYSENLEILTLTGTANINGTGNSLANTITGNSSNNVLNGGLGNDFMIGGAGNDTFQDDGGADSMTGGTGNDTFYVDDAGDVVLENAGEGIDLVFSSISRMLSQNVENLTLTGTANINGTGNSLANTITGNSGNNGLNGGLGNDILIGGAGNDVFQDSGGADTMSGGTGNDTFYVDDAGDVVIENAGEGTDLVFSSISRMLSLNVENLTLTGTGNIDGTGNDLDNVILGNAGNNTLIGNGGNDSLNGGAGADRMEGGTGNDTYFVDDAGDVVVEAANAGTDIVNSSVSFALRDFSQNLENLTLTGTANIDGVGNELANTITGNSGNNVLNGAMGNDVLIGGAGDDIFQDDSGADRMEGGTGNDTYFVDDAGDVVVEAANAGTDTVNSSISFALRNFSSNLENLNLTGSANINGIGNEQANVIVGNSGNNFLDGALGDDILIGGKGNDLFRDLGGADTFVFAANEGADRIEGFQDGIDHIDLTAFAVTETGGDSDWLQATTSATQVGGDVDIHFAGGGSLVLVGTLLSSLTDSDFLL